MKHSVATLYPFLLLFFLLLDQGALQAAEEGRFYGATETEYPEWFKESFLDLREDVDEAAQGGRRILLFFHQNGCPYCNLMVERNLAQRRIQALMKEKLDVIAINMFGDRDVVGLDGQTMNEKQFAESLRVQFTPSLLFLDETARVVVRLNGYIPPEKFKLALDYVTGHLEAQGSYRDYLAQNRPVAANARLNGEAFFMRPPFDLSNRGQRPLIVFFEQPQCPDCDRLHQQVLVDTEIRHILDNYDVVQLDMWSDTPVLTPGGERIRASAWARQLNVEFAPTFILFQPDGLEIIRSEAMFKRFHTASMLEYGLDGAYLKEPSFQRYISARSEYIRAQGKDVDIWK